MCSHLLYFVTTRHQAWYGMAPGSPVSSLNSPAQVLRYLSKWHDSPGVCQAEEELCTRHTITSCMSSWYSARTMRVITRSGAHLTLLWSESVSELFLMSSTLTVRLSERHADFTLLLLSQQTTAFDSRLIMSRYQKYCQARILKDCCSCKGSQSFP